MAMVAMILLVAVVARPGSLACAAPRLLPVAAALSPPLLLVPGAEGLAAKHEVVILDDGGDHPLVGPEVDLVG